MGPRENEAVGSNQANGRGTGDATRINIAMTAKILQFPQLKEDKDMELGTETTNTTPATTKRKQARKEKTILTGAPLKERKPRAKKPKADDAVRITPDLDRYKISKDVRTESGAPSIDINDKVARELRGLTLEQKYKAAAKELSETVAALEKRWGHLNPGQQAMCIANRLRAAAKREKK